MFKQMAAGAIAASFLGIGAFIVAAPASAGCTQVYYPGGAPELYGPYGVMRCFNPDGSPAPLPADKAPYYYDGNAQ